MQPTLSFTVKRKIYGFLKRWNTTEGTVPARTPGERRLGIGPLASRLGELNQEINVHCALPIIRNKGREHIENNPTIPLLLSSWYELEDGDSNAWIVWPPWEIYLYHFGLTRSGNHAEKAAYEDFRLWVAAYEFRRA